MSDQLKRVLLQLIMNRMVLKTRPPVVSGGESGDASGIDGLRRKVLPSGGRRCEVLLAAMTLDEKIAFISGADGFCLRGLPRLRIPPVWMADATNGVRGVDAPVTTFPVAVAMAATWNRDLVRRTAESIACECRAVGVSILLAPGVNIARVPICGRNFEYMGEDPYLAGELAHAYVSGAQGRGVAVTVKHFACNNSEYDRHKTDSVIDEKTLRELYLPAFERVVKGGVLGVMTAYNQVNGTYASEHAWLLEHLLRTEWGFKGIVVSDWNSLYSTEGPLLHGVDIEMPGGTRFASDRVKPLLESSPAVIECIDAKVRHILSVYEAVGVLDRPVADAKAPLGSDAHAEAALRMARESLVLMKNGGLLPLRRERLGAVVVLGRLVDGEPTGGGGSSFILRGLPGRPLIDSLREAMPESRVAALKGRWWHSAGKRRLVASADAVVVTTGFDHVYESEAYDRMWRLPGYEARTIREACALNKKTVVVLHAGGAVEMSSWIDGPNAVLDAFYLGTASSQAVTDVLLGDACPSGKLPFTVARNLEDYASMQNYPADFGRFSLARIKGGQGNPARRRVSRLRYDEGLMVGYRQFDTVGPEPLFPFGHGLSYTSFAYSDLRLSWEEGVLRASCTVVNSGRCYGSEVAQLYVRVKNPGRDRPFQQLRGFETCRLPPGAAVRVCFALTARDFSEFWVDQSSWVVLDGPFTICIGASSRDIRLSEEVVVPKSWKSPDHTSATRGV